MAGAVREGPRRHRGDGTSRGHANAFPNAVVVEPIAEAIARIRAAGGEIAGVRRLAGQSEFG